MQGLIMVCPRCKSKNFKPTEDVKYPLHNLGRKEHYDTVNIRRYICTCCGFKFRTQEIFFDEIGDNSLNQESLQLTNGD